MSRPERHAPRDIVRCLLLFDPRQDEIISEKLRKFIDGNSRNPKNRAEYAG